MLLIALAFVAMASIVGVVVTLYDVPATLGGSIAIGIWTFDAALAIGAMLWLAIT